MRNITNNMLLQACKLSTVKDVDMYIGGRVSDIQVKSLDNISEFIIINANNPKYFGAVALKLEKDIIISFSPSGELVDTFDWIGNIKTLYKPHPYSHKAVDFTKTVLAENSDISKVYITGHSLGGYLAQFATYHIYKNFKNVNLCTFNPLGFSAPNHIKNKYQLPIVKQKFKSYIAIFILRKLILNRAKPSVFNKKIIIFYKNLENSILNNGGIIDKNNKKWDDFCAEFDNIAVNYIIDTDPLYTILATKNIGKDIVLDSKYTKGLLKDGVKAHNLYNFIGRI